MRSFSIVDSPCPISMNRKETVQKNSFFIIAMFLINKRTTLFEMFPALFSFTFGSRNKPSFCEKDGKTKMHILIKCQLFDEHTFCLYRGFTRCQLNRTQPTLRHSGSDNTRQRTNICVDCRRTWFVRHAIDEQTDDRRWIFWGHVLWYTVIAEIKTERCEALECSYTK